MPDSINKFFNRHRQTVLLSALVLSVASFAYFTLHAPHSTLFTATFLDVGQGDASLLSRGDRQVLIDAGPDRSVLTGLGRAMPFFDRTIELIVLTHPHADHYAGFLDIFRRYQVQTIILPEYSSTAPEYKTFLTAVRDSGAAVTLLDCGESMTVSGIALKVLHPCRSHAAHKDPNEESLVLHVTGPDGGSILLTGDAPGALLERAAAVATGDWSSDILKVPHHGSRTGATAAFLKIVRPQYAAISVGRNTYGHPSPAVLERLNSVDVTICRTDRNGAVTFTYASHDWSVRAGKESCGR